jgi:serine/threonine protein kinase
MVDVPDSLGPYRIRSELGRGGMGVVFVAIDTRLDREVALKLLPAEVVDHAGRRSRFEREAKLLASLNHPNIATIHSLEEIDGVRFITMELLGGRSLDRLLETGALPVERSLGVCFQVAKALEAAHRTGMVHRDLKPPNVQVVEDGTVKVLDFGLALAVDGRKPELGRLDEAGAVGTPGYMSPEQLRDLPVDARADVFGLGCILFECLTGRAAFRRETLRETVDATFRREPEYHLLPEDTPEAIHGLLRRCLEKDPDRRLTDAAEAREVLQQEYQSPDREVRVIRATFLETPTGTLRVGDPAPAFELAEASGDPFRSPEPSRTGPLVVGFYRGVW